MDRVSTTGRDSLAQTDAAQNASYVVSPWIMLLRPAHWLKNLLLVVPLVFAHSAMSFDLFAHIALGIVAMSFAASAGYIVNDFKDAAFDRMHQYKRQRPIAKGLIKPTPALLAVLGLGAASLGISASLLGNTVTWMIVAYIGATIAYSSYLRRVAVVDVLALAALYIWRLHIGGEISETPLSAWLTCLAASLFIALALMKRLDELASLKSPSTGRGYNRAHWPALLASTIFFAATATLICTAYVAFSEAAALYYRSPGWLWLATLAFLLWLAHLLRHSTAGKMAGDPVVFTATDSASLALMVGGAVAYFAAI